jgi:hypothetical protein
MTNNNALLIPPSFCQYSCGQCDQSMSNIVERNGFFVYPSHPPILANTVREAVRQLQSHSSPDHWQTWEKLNIGGQIIFCEICKAIRSAKVIIANITSMNFNVLFELGYAIGLGKPVLPVRDMSFGNDNMLFNEVGIFDTIGYKNFSNSHDLVGIVQRNESFTPPIQLRPEINKRQPIYYVRAPIETDGSIKLFSSLKKCAFQFRTFDVREMSRISLHEAYKQVLSSISVIAHLMDPSRNGAVEHNSRAAFICGMAMAAEKHVLMLQEGILTQPIDYRDVVISYLDPNRIANYVESNVRSTAETMQSIKIRSIPVPRGIIERIDLGDVAAENEIQSLTTYFVKTPQFQQVKQGHARIVIGRKGTGKTALFYGVRSQFWKRKDKIVLDLKPEGHQFVRLREMVLSKLSTGLQQHTLTAFWHYLLLLEIVGKIIERIEKNAYQNSELLDKYQHINEVYKKYTESEGDFSERLMMLVNKLIENFPSKSDVELKASEITGAIYSSDISHIHNIILTNLDNTLGLLILFDNIDKGFPSNGITKEDALIVQCLLDATRKIQHFFESHNLECNTTIFIRRDVFDHLIDKTSDRGKDSFVNLDWSDVELIKELLLKRFQNEVEELQGDFDDIWNRVFDPHVGGESSFLYITSRTFLRPRDILNLIRKCIQVAVSRGHSRVEQDDITAAEKEFSEDMLNELRYEIRDVFPNIADIVNCFMGLKGKFSREDIYVLFDNSKVRVDDFEKLLNVLLWFSFVGVSINDEEYYAYKMQYNTLKLLSLINYQGNKDNVFVIHPAFRSALSI